MGGGVGLSVHGSHSVASEKFLFAMPETTIGLFPDVGGGYFLTRLQGALGTFLALTSHRLKIADAVWAGIVDAHVPSAKMNELQAALGAADISGPGANQQVDAVIAKFTADPGLPTLPAMMHDIDRCFSAESVAEIEAKLKTFGGEWADKQLAALMKLSPLAMAITLEQLRRCANRSFEDSMTIEYRMSQACMRPGHDFFEGVRALLIDKDQKPKWNPPTIDGVTRRWSRRISSRCRTTCSSTDGTRGRRRMAKIAFIGLGNMGGPMAANLAKAQHHVMAFDLSAPALAAAVEKGAHKAASAAEAVKDAEIVVTMLPAGKHVREVYEKDVLPNVAKGALLIDCSTIDVDSARHVAAAGQGGGLRDGRCAGLGRRRRRHGRHAHLHGRRAGGGVRQGQADPRQDGQEHRPCRRQRQRAGGQDLQQHDPRHLDDRRVRGLHAGQAAGPRRAEAVQRRVDRVRLVLVAGQLLPGAGPGADLAGQPRLPGGLHRGDDAEGPDAGAAGGGRVGRQRRRWAPRRRSSSACSSTPATSAKDFSGIIKMIDGK